MITKRTVLITASAIAIAAIAITAIFLMTSGISKADAENTASGYVPQGAEYIKTEIDDGVYEVTYRDNGLGREYEVHVSRETGAIVGISMDSDRDHGGATAKLTAAQAEAAVKDEISGIASAKVYQEKDDDGIFYDVEFTASDFYGSAEVNAETGAVVEYTIRYGSPVVIPSTGSASGNTQAGDDTAAKNETSAKDDNQAAASGGKAESNTQSGSQSGTQSNSQSSAGSSSGQSSAGNSQSQSGSQQPAQKPSGGTSQSGGSSTSQLISADKAKSIVLAKIGNNNAFIKELELDRDDGIYQYEGEAYYNGYEYDFEINASSGVIIKWEVDREDWD
ncbi:MAG TPA: PepSY domain-containing protein [Candidatus Avanaerovorax faecigallinarum]|nr:PepSY domain-containing protein [Candidatus Avanaerovorax faecigallinarum]